MVFNGLCVQYFESFVGFEPSKNFKMLFITIINVVKWKKKNTEMPSRFVYVTDIELTQFLEKM